MEMTLLELEEACISARSVGATNDSEVLLEEAGMHSSPGTADWSRRPDGTIALVLGDF